MLMHLAPPPLALMSSVCVCVFLEQALKLQDNNNDDVIVHRCVFNAIFLSHFRINDSANVTSGLHLVQFEVTFPGNVAPYSLIVFCSLN